MSALATPDTAGSLAIEERTDTEFAFEDGDNERFAHYVDKTKAMEATVYGTPCVALCGKKWVPTKDPERFPVCPTCKDIYNGIPSGEGPSDGAGE